ncbi:hypothetical protein [Noviherbaspirillum saxi]|uniref:Uncharacterized protein n=1 Tax=Noviherbaspirillum saxi TaxID=2320863 RepID=A0A3A3FRU5_9BURK|nr:hypothetical protein [Noviherbaspirillum saxi]RJF98766.1 hypothetical protein D3871_09750 [Noviherbaspirillum saxi]
MPVNASQLNAELAHDLQSGLGLTVINEFDHLQIVGMASILSLHIKGLGQLEYDVLRQVAYYFWDITGRDLNQVLNLLAEIEYIDLITSGSTITKVIPKIPHFDSVYSGIGEYLANQHLNEKEQLTLAILGELTNKPEKRNALIGRLGAEVKLFTGCERIVSESGLVLSKRARGQDILVSPTYFADNLDSVVDLAAAGGAKRIERILNLVGQSQGWPLSLIEKQGEVAGYKIDSHELNILKSLVGDGVLKPPSIKRPSANIELFIFTPRPGNIRLNAANRNIYEKAMGLVASIRKGQLLEERYRIKYPVALLQKLRNFKAVGANSEALVQYRNLVNLQVGKLVKVGSDRYQLQLIDTPENLRAVDEAIALIQTGQMKHSSVDEEARIALTQDEAYVQSLTSSANFRKMNKLELLDEEKSEVEQLLLDL